MINVLVYSSCSVERMTKLKLNAKKSVINNVMCKFTKTPPPVLVLTAAFSIIEMATITYSLPVPGCANSQMGLAQSVSVS